MSEVTHFGIFAETERDDFMLTIGLDATALLETYVRPYEAGDAFRIDGVTVTQESLHRFLIFSYGEYFESESDGVGYAIRSRLDGSKTLIDGYSIVVRDLIRNHGRDVTNEMVSAYQQEKDSVQEATDLGGRISLYEKIMSAYSASMKALEALGS